MEKQLKLFFWNNQNLFSNNYLEHRLPYTSLWSEQKEKAKTAFDLIKKSYESIKDLHLGPGQEKELEDKFIRPVLNALDFTYHVEPVTKRGYKKKRPDFALFEDMKSYRSASSVRDHPEKFFSQTLTILESKYWGRRLNDTDKSDVLDSRDPTAQTVKYLDDVHFHTNGKINWAILTNGKHWRLFYYRAASRSGNFFEVDLEEIITNGNIEEFLYFYLFFSRDAFITDPPTGKTWLDQHLKGTEEYAVRVSTKLKDLIFDKVFEGLAEGFVHFRRYELSIQDKTDGSRKNIFKECLTLLYRLLFLLYAESRNLLPVQEPAYYKASLLNLKKDIYHDISTLGLEKMSKKSYSYWSRLESLFDIVAKGDSALNVPIYNGGLFETSRDNFLSTHKMSDPFLAEAIELLTVDHEGKYRPDTIPFIDYSSLNVRHLGDIYEGLLEFHVQIAEEDIVAVRKEGKSLWLKAAEVKEKTKISEKKKKGEVYIENSKHERKASGSYYTPHYIVEYIVKNTVGPVLEERLKTAGELLLELDEAYKTLHKQRSTVSIQGYRARIRELEDSIFNTLFDLKVLDPAMGSGHFLVHTVDFISDRIISFLADYPENPVIRKIAQLKNEILQEITQQGVRIDERKLTEVNLIKRMVMKRCIYGVDLNDMAVELAKLSLWLDSFTLGAPLSFLDHHLKCGNSLIGIFEISDVIIPGSESYGKVQRALSFMLQVSDLTDATISEAQKSYDLFKNAQQEITPIRRRFDVSAAKHFADLGSNIGYLENLAYTLNFDKEPFPENIERCKKALHIAEEKKFFHWRLEFPEVFYTEKGEKENPGFDCVIGNPPWGAEFEKLEKQYLKIQFRNIIVRMSDSYMYFIKQSAVLTKIKSFAGLIIPNPFLTQIDMKILRKYLVDNCTILAIINLGGGVFGTNVANPSCIIIFQNSSGLKNNVGITNLRHLTNRQKEDLFSSVSLPIKYINIETFYKTKDNSFITEGFEYLALIENLKQRFPVLKDFVLGEIQRGISADYADAFIIDKSLIDNKKIESHICKPILTGHNVSRYQVYYLDEFIIYLNRNDDIEKYPKAKFHLAQYKNQITCEEVKEGKHPWYSLHRPRDPIIFNSPKLVGLTTTNTLLVGLDVNNLYAMDNLYLIQFKSKNIKTYFFMLSLLNSTLLICIYKFFAQEENRVLPQVKAKNLYLLPIPSISFTTPEKERKEFFKEAVNLYKGSEYEDILKWAEHELALKRNDTIHDFLAYLAEQMIELNKRKNEEIKGFLKWLEREIGAEIDTLTNKTAIKEYREHSFEHLLDVFKKNRNKISIDPSDRKKQELLENHFTKSVSVLEPLKGKIKNTDNLIDRIVYKLYGLTDEEIELVEGSQKG